MATEIKPLIIFHPYQQRWIGDKSRFKIGMFARQTGKTFSTSAEIVEDCVKAEAEGRRVRWVILSKGERQAQEAMNEGVKPILKAFYAIYKELDRTTFEETSWVTENGATYRAQECELPSGSRITALPANPDTARGYSANVFLDEFGFHADSRSIWKALFPVVSKGGLRLRITSTPNGKGNKFYELWTAQTDVWSRHSVNILEAVADGLDRDVGALREALNDEEAWQQEYMLEFLDGAGSWLNWDDILACEHADAAIPELYQGGPCVIGNDIARRRDLWVATVLERVGNNWWERERVELRGASFAAQDAEVDRLMASYRVLRMYMDQTGMGEKPVEDAIRRYGASRVQGVVLSGARRLAVAQAIRQAYEDRRVRIQAGNRLLRADLHSIKKVTSPTGSPRLLAETGGESHADRFWSQALALAAAEQPVAQYDYTPANSSPPHSSLRTREDFDDDGHGGLNFAPGAF